jgi:hypothetical protein
MIVKAGTPDICDMHKVMTSLAFEEASITSLVSIEVS